MKSRVYYEVDPHNRLVVKSLPKKSNVKKFRKVVEGRFKTDEKNRLYYEVFKSSKSNIPQKIKFSGKYSLDMRHNLNYTLDKWGNQYAGNRLRLKTVIMDANSNRIVFIVNSKKSIYTMKLQGAWHADKNNRLAFGIDKQGDELTLSNAWKVNKHNEIIYRYGKDPREISLKGSWDIKNKHRLSYLIDKRRDSGLDFRASFGQIVPKKKRTYLKFDVIIDVSKRKKIKRKITFCGTCRLTKNRKILLELSPGKEKKLSLKLTKRTAYIESFIKGKERYLGGGIAFRW